MKSSIIKLKEAPTTPTTPAKISGETISPVALIAVAIDDVITAPIIDVATPFAALSCPVTPPAAPTDALFKNPIPFIRIFATSDEAPAILTKKNFGHYPLSHRIKWHQY